MNIDLLGSWFRISVGISLMGTGGGNGTTTCLGSSGSHFGLGGNGGAGLSALGGGRGGG